MGMESITSHFSFTTIIIFSFIQKMNEINLKRKFNYKQIKNK